MKPVDLACHPRLRSRNLVGDPIDVVTGANTDIALDFELPGPIPLHWHRYYNSALRTAAGPLGWGHAHEFHRSLTKDLDGVRYADPLGKIVPFPPLEVGASAVSGGLLLRRVSPSTYQVIQAGEPVEEFEFTAAHDTANVSRLRRGEHRIEFRYTPEGRLRGIIDSLRRPIVVESDPSGRVRSLVLIDDLATRTGRTLIAYQYDAAGNLIAARDLPGATLAFEWDAQNRVTRRTDRLGYSFHFAYNDAGRCIHSRGDDGLFEVFLSYQPELKTTVVRRGDGGEWTYLYDDAGNVTQITNPYAGATRFTADDTGRITEETDANGNVTQLLYDSMGKHYARLHPLGYLLPTYEEDPNPPDPLDYELPATPLEWEHGDLLAPEQIVPPVADDPALQGVSPSIRRLLLEPLAPAPLPAANDEQGRPIEEGAPGRMQRWKYDPNGNLAEHQDRDGAVYRYAYESWNALHQETDPLGHTTVYHHSVQGLVNRVEDPGGTVTDYAYDLNDRLSEVRRHGRVRDRYRYDAAGNIVAKQNDAGHNLVVWKIGVATLDASRQLASGETHTFAYDDRGRMTAAVTPTGAASFAFLETGERLADLRDGQGVVHEFVEGQLSATTCLGQFRISYRTGADGERIITDPTGARHHLTVSDGGLVSKRFANGTRELAQYDSQGRCVRKVLAGSEEHQPWARSFTYSPAGDLLGVTDSHQGTVRYQYDQAHRLSQETLPDGTARSFAFDPAGNLQLQPGLSGVAMDSGNRLRTANGDRFSYDDRDHLSLREGAAGHTRYEYNALDLLVRCEINADIWTATYDALCRRVSKTWRGQTTTYYWDDFRLAAEVFSNGSLRVYVYEDQAALVPFLFIDYDGRDADPASGRRHHVFTNQIGVPVRVEDSTGQSRWSARVDPFGQAHVSPGSSLEMPLRFPGHYHDPETGLHYNRFRYFSPELGRYLQSDPAGLEGGINLYAYPTNPLTGVDIDGLKKGGGGGKKRTGKKGEGTAGGGASCPLAGNKGKRAAPLPKDPPVKVGDVGKYKNLVARGRKGDGLTPDHIPSAASLIAAENARRKKAGKRPMTPKEMGAVRDNGNCVVVPHDQHVAGETYGGNNTSTKIAADSKDKKSMAAAEKRDMDAHKDSAEDHGVEPSTMNQAARELKKANEADGVTK